MTHQHTTVPVIVTEQQAPSAPNSKLRSYYYDAEFRLALALDITSDGEILVALAACRDIDIFQKRTTRLDRERGTNRRNAKLILDGRLNLQYELMRTGQDDKRNNYVVRFANTYAGDKPLRDVWFPVLDAFRKFVHETYGEPYQKKVKRNGKATTELAYRLVKNRNVDHIMYALNRYAERFEPLSVDTAVQVS